MELIYIYIYVKFKDFFWSVYFLFFIDFYFDGRYNNVFYNTLPLEVDLL